MIKFCENDCPRITYCLLCLNIDTPKQLLECPCYECVILAICGINCEKREGVYKIYEHAIDQKRIGKKIINGKWKEIPNVPNRKIIIGRYSDRDTNDSKLPRSKKNR